jgi:hypothetical protein
MGRSSESKKVVCTSAVPGPFCVEEMVGLVTCSDCMSVLPVNHV